MRRKGTCREFVALHHLHHSFLRLGHVPIQEVVPGQPTRSVNLSFSATNGSVLLELGQARDEVPIEDLGKGLEVVHELPAAGFFHGIDEGAVHSAELLHEGLINVEDSVVGCVEDRSASEALQ